MAKHHPPSVAWKGFGNPWEWLGIQGHWSKTIRLGIGQAIPEVDWNWVRVDPTRLVSGSSIGAPEPGGSSASQRCFGGFSWVGSARARRWSIFTGAKGYPLKALFWGVFTGEFDRNERNACFSRFSHVLQVSTRFVGWFKPRFACHSNLLRIGVRKPVPWGNARLLPPGLSVQSNGELRPDPTGQVLEGCFGSTILVPSGS